LVFIPLLSFLRKSINSINQSIITFPRLMHYQEKRRIQQPPHLEMKKPTPPILGSRLHL